MPLEWSRDRVHDPRPTLLSSDAILVDEFDWKEEEVVESPLGDDLFADDAVDLGLREVVAHELRDHLLLLVQVLAHQTTQPLHPLPQHYAQLVQLLSVGGGVELALHEADVVQQLHHRLVVRSHALGKGRSASGDEGEEDLPEGEEQHRRDRGGVRGGCRQRMMGWATDAECQ